MRAILMDLRRQRGDRHRALPLAIELCELGSKAIQRGPAVFDIHRPTTIVDLFQVRSVDIFIVVKQALDHGWCSKEHHPRPMPDDLKNL